LAVDPSFEFEKRRNVPVKYDRELWTTTGKNNNPCFFIGVSLKSKFKLHNTIMCSLFLQKQTNSNNFISKWIISFINSCSKPSLFYA